MNADFSAKLDEILANPAMLAQIKALADTMTQNSAKPQDAPAESTPQHDSEPKSAPKQPHDPASMPTVFSPSPNLEQNLKNTKNLLVALKPFLDEKRCMKIDKMLSMMRLAEMAEQFGNLL